MEYIIGGLVILLGLFVTGYFMKKKYYKEVDRLEAWKIDITNRPVLDEMSKVKQLNMTGETEELFERWRNDWDDIVTAQLPDVEEYLFDAEEYIDRYRFKKAKEVQKVINDHLAETEEKIQVLLNEINDLVGSEEKNRTEIEELKEKYRESKKTLLAHRHTFGQAETQLEKSLDDVIAKLKEFDERTLNGDYLQAREIVLIIKDLIGKIEHKMELIPHLLVECHSNLPSQIIEVKEGYREMLEQGYILDHIQLEKEVERLENVLATYISYIEKTEVDEVQKGLGEMKESIDLLYDLLEKEVHSRHFISENEIKTKESLHSAKQTNEVLKTELHNVLQSYHLSEKELEAQRHLEKNLTHLWKRFELLEFKVENQKTAHSILSDELTEIRNELKGIQEEQSNFAEKLQALRKDEIVAREKVVELTRMIGDTIRLVTKSNIPGIPNDYKHLIEDAKESIQNVQNKIDEKPLDIPTVQQHLEIAVMTVEKVHTTTTEMLETVMLVEKVIQYGNRYRRSYPSVDKGLKEAESAFRSFDYSTALEQAATSIEAVEPGAIKKLEALMGETK